MTGVQTCALPIYPEKLKQGFLVIQEAMTQGLLLSGHDRSDGGLITTLLEMAFAGNCGLDLNLQSTDSALAALFSEELGLVVECTDDKLTALTTLLQEYNLTAVNLGHSTEEKQIKIRVNDESVLDEDMRLLREWWEETSYQLERLQVNADCADAEKKNSYDRQGPEYKLSFTPEPAPAELLAKTDKPKVAILRDEGSNSDREMSSAFYMAGFEPWDITMSDLLAGRVNLDEIGRAHV